jgi:serine/threonine protein kinase
MTRRLGVSGLEGAELGPYALVRRVGAGSFASVFEATHRALGKRVAIKVLHEHLADDERIVGRFLREGRVVAKLQHPNIIDVLDVGSEGGVPYLVMSFLRGKSLRAHMSEVRVMSLARALDLLLPIASALAHAHDAGVIHRDVKPANVFLAEDDRGDLTPTLVDFGLSKAANAPGAVTAALTSTELVAGTVQYMAPEQTFGVKNASPASDQYSFAIMLYEAVTGEPPFTADGVYSLIERIREDAIKPPSLVHAGISPAFDDVLLRAASRKPDKRWPTMRDLTRALLAFASESTASAFGRELEDRPSASPRVTSRPSLRVAPGAQRGQGRGTSEPAPAISLARIEPGASNAPLPVPPGKGPFGLKGNAYRGIVHHAKRLFPPDGVDKLCEVIDDAAVSEFLRQPFLASGHYDMFPIVPISAAFARLVGESHEAFVRRTSAAQARYDARTIFRHVVDVRPIEEAADRLARLGSRFYDFGEFTGSIPEPGRVSLVHAGVPVYALPWYEPMIVTYASVYFSILAGKRVTRASYSVINRGKDKGYPVVTGEIRVEWSSV